MAFHEYRPFLRPQRKQRTRRTYHQEKTLAAPVLRQAIPATTPLRTSDTFSQLPGWLWSESFVIVYDLDTKRFTIHFSSNKSNPLLRQIEHNTSTTGNALTVRHAIVNSKYRPTSNISMASRLGEIPHSLMQKAHRIHHNPLLTIPVQVHLPAPGCSGLVSHQMTNAVSGFGQNIGQAVIAAFTQLEDSSKKFETGRSRAAVAEAQRMAALRGSMTTDLSRAMVRL